MEKVQLDFDKAETIGLLISLLIKRKIIRNDFIHFSHLFNKKKNRKLIASSFSNVNICVFLSFVKWNMIYDMFILWYLASHF